MRLLVCGGRDYTNGERAFEILDMIDMLYCIDLIIQGGQKTWDRDKRKYVGGGDYWGDQWALSRGVCRVEEKADWDKWQKRAGMIRNQAMIDKWSPTHTLALRGGNGTANMIDLSRRAGIPVWTEDHFLGEKDGLG